MLTNTHALAWSGGKISKVNTKKAKKDHDKFSIIFPYDFNSNISKGSH
jgi:hypothetical protein